MSLSRSKPAVPIAGKYRLIDALTDTEDYDLGGEVVPRAIHKNNVFGFEFEGYWEDIGTIRSFYDKNARLGPGADIRPFPRGTEQEGRDWLVRDGIVVVPKNTTLPAGTVIAPD